MIFLHDPTWQFIITTSTSIVISIITSSIAIWFTLRVPIELPISYETLEIEPIQGDEHIKAIKEKMQIPLEGKTSDSLCLFTFKIWNNGKKPIQLSNPTPLIIRFKNLGVKILGWDKLEREPDYIKVTPTIVEREVRLDLPFLDAKHSITMQLLLSDYVNDSIDFYAEVHHGGRNKFTKANNTRSSRENKIVGIIAICFAVCSVIILYPSLNAARADSLYSLIVVYGGCFLIGIIGIVFLYTSYLEKSLPPHHGPHFSKRIKDEFKTFLSVLPGVIVVVGIAIAISFLFGEKVLVNCIMTFVFLIFPVTLWYGIYNLAKWILKKLKNNYTSILIIILVGIVPVVILVREMPLIVFVWTRP